MGNDSFCVISWHRISRLSLSSTLPYLPPARPRPSPPLPSPFYGTTSSKPVTRGPSGRGEQEPRSRLRRHHHTGRSLVRLLARPPARRAAGRSLLLSPLPLFLSSSSLRLSFGLLRWLLAALPTTAAAAAANSHESAAAVHQPTSNSTTSASDRGGRDDHAYLPSERDGGISNSNARILRSRASRKSNKLFEFSYAQT